MTTQRTRPRRIAALLTGGLLLSACAQVPGLPAPVAAPEPVTTVVVTETAAPGAAPGASTVTITEGGTTRASGGSGSGSSGSSGSTGSGSTGSTSSGSGSSGTTTATPAASGIVLQKKSVGNHRFGEHYKAIEDDLRAKLGKPTKVFEDEGCPMDPRWARHLVWKGLSVGFESQQATKTSKMYLYGWFVTPSKGLPAGVSLASGLPLRTTYQKLRKRYPNISMESMFEGSDSYSDLGNGIRYSWNDSSGSSVLQIVAAPLRGCE